MSEQVLGTYYLAPRRAGEVAVSHTARHRADATLRQCTRRPLAGYLNKGMIALFRGEWQECEELLQLAIDDAQTSKEMRQTPLGIVAKAMYYLRREDWQHAEPLSS